jgi:hypothetical protein
VAITKNSVILRAGMSELLAARRSRSSGVQPTAMKLVAVVD